MEPTTQPRRRNPIIGYFIGAKEELKRVTWPTTEQVRKSTITVLVVSAIFAAFLGIVDYIFNLGILELL